MASITQLAATLNHGLHDLTGLTWPEQAQVKVIAPHPDDFDAIATTLQYFQQQGYDIQLLVLSGGSKGVEDRFLNTDDWQQKARIREQEQINSTRLFSLRDEQVLFLRMPEADDGELAMNEYNQQLLQQQLLGDPGDIWCLPYGKDSNTAHQRTYTMIQTIGSMLNKPILALLNNDAKTLEFEARLYMPFTEQQASWKAELLRCHKSQQARNLNVRGYGFDQRVLRFNQETAAKLGIKAAYAEAFQIALL